MGNQQEAQLAKLQDISRQLVEKSILSNFIQADVAQVTSRWSKIKQQVSNAFFLKINLECINYSKTTICVLLLFKLIHFFLFLYFLFDCECCLLDGIMNNYLHTKPIFQTCRVLSFLTTT